MRRARIVRIEWNGKKHPELNLSNSGIRHALEWEWEAAGCKFTVTGEPSFEVEEK